MPDDKLVVEIDNGVGAALAIAIDSLTDLLTAGRSASVTFTVKLLVPVAVGFPEIRPVDEPRVRPAGRLPDVMDHA